MAEAMLEYNLCTPSHLPHNIYENLQTSEACISKTSDQNAIKLGRVVNNAIVYNISNVRTCSSYFT